MQPTEIFGVNISNGINAIDDATARGREIRLDRAQVARINTHLDAAQERLDVARSQMVVTIAGSAVGGSPVGRQLAHHSGLADQTLSGALSDMEQGIAYYRDAVAAAVARFEGADEESATSTRRGESFFSATTGQPMNRSGDA